MGGQALEKGVNFSRTPMLHMQESGRFVPVQQQIAAIRYGVPMLDPRGSHATMHVIEMSYKGKIYVLEVLYDVATNTIWHYKISPWR